MLFYYLTLMAASRFVNNCHGKTGILSITFAKREQYSQKLVISTLRFQMRRNCQHYNVEGLPQNELTQLQHLWYLSNFSCSKYGKISHVTWKIPLLVKHCSLTVVNWGGSLRWTSFPSKGVMLLVTLKCYRNEFHALMRQWLRQKAQHI
jgi:hypothetical protein